MTSSAVASLIARFIALLTESHRLSAEADRANLDLLHELERRDAHIAEMELRLALYTDADDDIPDPRIFD